MENLNASGLLIIANLLVLIGGIVSGYFILRSNLARGAQELQEQVRVALKDENEGLARRLERVEDDYAMCKRQLELVVEIFKQQGIIVEINGEMVQVRDGRGRMFGRTPTPRRARLSPPNPKDSA